MMYRTVPRKTRIDSKSDLASYREIQALFSRHGYGIAHFSHRGVEFYDARQCVKQTVPITSYFMVNKKEFLLFVDIVKRLDESEQKMQRLVKWAGSIV